MTSEERWAMRLIGSAAVTVGFLLVGSLVLAVAVLLR
jgi:hypothetical protein